MAKYTESTYIETAIKKWGDKFDYTETHYINSYHTITVRCIKHNELIEADPISFIRNSSNKIGDFCKHCKKNEKVSGTDFMNRIQKYRSMYDLSKVNFINIREPITLVCPIHMHTFEVEADVLLERGIKTQCPLCLDSKSIISCNNIENTEDAVFYNIIVTHKPTKLQFLKIGTSLLTSYNRYDNNTYKDFNFEVVEEYFDKYINVIEMEIQYKKYNKDKRLFLPKNIKFNGTDCYIIDDIIQLKANQVKIVRDGLIEYQHNICPLCNNDIKAPTLDHSHTKRHSGDGKIRGVLCNNCNRMLGVIENKASMNGIEFSELPNVLRAIATFVERTHYPYIHPTEAPKIKKLGKRIFNKIAKLYKLEFPNRKDLIFPKNGKPTKQIIELANHYQIQL